MLEEDTAMLDKAQEHLRSAELLPQHGQLRDAVSRAYSAEAIRRPAVAGAVDPAPTSIHSVRARRRPLGVWYRSPGIGPIPILYPLPYVAMHVVQPPGVRFLPPQAWRVAKFALPSGYGVQRFAPNALPLVCHGGAVSY